MKRLIFILLFIPCLIVPAQAENASDALISEADIYDIENSLTANERAISGELKLDGSYDQNSALKRLTGHFALKLREGLREELGFMSAIIAICFFCALCSSLCGDRSISFYIETIGCCTIAYMLSGSVEGLISEAVSAITRLSDYSRAAMPAIFTAAAACGAVGSASVKYAAACFAMEIFMSAARELLVPMIYAFLALSLSSAVFDNALLKAVSKTIKSLSTYLISGICIIFSAYISLSGVISGSADAVAVKTAKTLISNALPIVGGIVSDSASVVLASASLIKNSAGIFALTAVCIMCIGPFAVLSVKVFLYKIAAAIAEILPGGRISALLGSIGSTMAMLLALIGSCGLMLFISIMSGIKVVSL